MPQNRLNYPDVLGAITGDKRLNAGVVQCAIATRPRIARAGKPLEVVLLIQSAADCPVEVIVTLNLPEQDANRRKGRFTARAKRLAVGLQPAEVGYVTLPVMIAPDTTPARGYKLSVDIAAKPTGKPQRVRTAEGGAPLQINTLRSEQIAQIEALKGLTYSHTPVSRLRPGSLEASFNLLAGDASETGDLRSGWVSLWQITDYKTDDASVILRKHYQELRDYILPHITHDQTVKALQERTQKRFADAGYPLHELELVVIARTLAHVLQYAVPPEQLRELDKRTFFPHDILYVDRVFEDADYLLDGRPVALPNWAIRMLSVLEIEKRAAQYPVRALVHFAYDELLRDAILFTFAVLQDATGEDLGTPEEMAIYANQVVELLDTPGSFDFAALYMPLVMGGLLVFNHALLRTDNLRYILDDIMAMDDLRVEEHNEETAPLLDMLRFVVRTVLYKFGHVQDVF